MKIQVVFNICFGGFGISKKCAKRMVELGSKAAAKVIEENGEDSYWHGSLPYDYPRHCPILVQAVLELEADASAASANLCVATLEGDRYIIKEYDGAEGVVEPDDIDWVIVQTANQ